MTDEEFYDEYGADYLRGLRDGRADVERLQLKLHEAEDELVRAKLQINTLTAHCMEHGPMIDYRERQIERLRSILAGLIDSSDRGDTGSDSSYARYWAEARQALEGGK